VKLIIEFIFSRVFAVCYSFTRVWSCIWNFMDIFIRRYLRGGYLPICL